MATINNAAQGVGRIRLSLAISLKDKYSGGRPQGEVNLFLESNERQALNPGSCNPSGYYTFTNLPKGSYNINVVSEYYLDKKVQVDIEGDKYIYLDIHLIPSPSYPFPPGETLVRGILRYSDGGSVPGAIFKYSLHASFSNQTDEKGEFVIFFGALSEEDVMEEKGIKYLISHDAQGKSKEIPVECYIDGKLMQIENKLSDIAVGTIRSWNPMLTT